ncbi:MAG: ABC transporter ATP-binding protein [Desulfohalobiaceae bacterium]
MIRIQGLSKYYDDVCAVDNFDLEVPGGQILGLLGPNGAGKTTILRILTGYISPTSGNIRIADMDPTEDPLPIKARVGYVPESIPLYRNMLVYDFFRYMIRVRRLSFYDSEAQIQKIAEMFSINEVMHKNIGELSKGYLQRVGLAHALLPDPDVLILDEPTSGLDPNQIQEIRSLIREMGREKTVLLSTHILSEAEATCDRITIVNKGQTVADGTPHELKGRAREGYSVTLELKHATFDQAQAVLRDVHGVDNVLHLGESEAGLKLRLECSGGDDPRERIYEAVKTRDWKLLEMSPEVRSLEHIFKELTLEN